MFIQLLSFEWRYHRQHISFIAFALLFSGLGFMLSGNAFGEANLYHNATYNIHKVMGLLSIVAIFFIMVMSSRVVLRDKNNQMSELVYTTPVLKHHFLSSRFLGLFFSSSIMFCFAILGLWLGALMAPGAAGKIGPILAIHYLWPFLCLALPNILIASVVVFMIASLTKNAAATYIGGILLYCLYWVGAIFFNSPMIAGASPASPEGLALAALLDPFGLSAFFEQSQYWETWERNASLIALKGNFLWNRTGWLAVGILLLLINYHLFSFRKGKEKAEKEVEKLSLDPSCLPSYAQKTIDLSFTRHWQQFRSSFQIEITQLLGSWPLRIALILWMAVVATEILTRIYGGGEYGTNLYPTTNLMIWLIEDPYQILSRILIIFFGGEMMTKERAVGIYEIKDATPINNRISFFSKFLSLSSIPFLLLLSAILVAVICQLAKAYTQLEPMQYVIMFYFLGVPLVFFTLLVLFIQTLVSNKYLGMFFCLLFTILVSSSLSGKIGLEHPLLKIGWFPTVSYNNMNGFDPLATSFHWIGLYWASLGLLFGFACLMLWKRGSSSPLFSRIRLTVSRFKPSKSWFPLIGLLLFLITGSIIYNNTNQLNTYTSAEEVLDRQAAYEKKYKGFDKWPEMRVISLRSTVDLYPEKRAFHIKHDFRLKNKTEEMIRELWFTVPHWVKVNKFTISGAKLVHYDSLHNVYWFEMTETVLPGEERQMAYDIEDGLEGFQFNNAIMDRAIVQNGTNIMSKLILPSFGYRDAEEIRDNQERKKRGLPTLEERESEVVHAGLEEETAPGYNKFSFETIISTTSGQTAIAPGNLINQWVEKDRHFFHFKSDQPINHFYSYISAKYQVQQLDHQGVKLEIFYDQAHHYNIDRMLETMEVTLDYCQSAFAPYHFNHLRIAEIPAHWPAGGFATAGTIALVENRSFLTDLRDTAAFDVVTKRVAHEVAHQWFGHQLTPLLTEGASMLIESTAKYIECIIQEKQQGKNQLRHLLKVEMDRYFQNRNRSQRSEPPLDQVDDQGFISYSKGAIVMNALRDLLGEAQLNTVIRQFMDTHAYPKPKATAADFVQLLYTLSPEDKRAQIEDWVSKVVIYDNKINKVSHRHLADGQFEVTARIEAKKYELKQDGQLHEMPMNELVNVGLFQLHPDELRQFSPKDYFQKHLIRSGTQEIVIRTRDLPKFVTLDPYLHLMDKNVYDNIIEVK